MDNPSRHLPPPNVHRFLDGWLSGGRKGQRERSKAIAGVRYPGDLFVRYLFLPEEALLIGWSRLLLFTKLHVS